MKALGGLKPKAFILDGEVAVFESRRESRCFLAIPATRAATNLPSIWGPDWLTAALEIQGALRLQLRADLPVRVGGAVHVDVEVPGPIGIKLRAR